MKVNITGTIVLTGGFVKEFEDDEYTLPDDLIDDIVSDIEEYLQDGNDVDEDIVIQVIENWISNEHLEEMLDISGIIDLDYIEAEVDLSYSLPYNNMDEIYDALKMEFN